MIPSPSRLNPRALAVAALADAACVLVFVAIGRNTHDDGFSFGGLLTTGWPFWLGVAGGYVGVMAFRLAPASLPGAAMVVVKTLVVGMILRSVAQNDGTATSFVVVATVFLTVTMVGWRAALAAVAQRQARTNGVARTPERVS